MSQFTVEAGGTAHEVRIGSLGDSAELVRDLCRRSRIPLVTDERLLDLYGDFLDAHLPFELIMVPEGEAAKSWRVLEAVIEALSALNVTRDSAIVAFGGGSIGDVAGLAAALFKRGCPIVHIPTTLVAQVDSAIGGKTAIDACGQKNLVGAFHPPALVLADPAFLATLDAQQMRGGYAELVKYGLIEDAAFFAWCEANGAALLQGDTEAQVTAIDHCLRAKARFVAEDFHDRLGRRALLNFGHSFGHAIESVAGLGSVHHGEAVAVGMNLAFGLSVDLGLCAKDEAERVRAHLTSVGLPTRLAELGLEGRAKEMIRFIRQDKKSAASGVTLILSKGIGKAFVARDFPTGRIADFLREQS